MSERKRRRDSDESEESLPLSKRINGLNIDYTTDDSGDSSSKPMHHGNAANQHLPFMGNSSSSHFGDVNAPEMQQLVAVPNICVHCGDYFNTLTSPINPSVGAICQKCQAQRLTNGTGDTECDMDTKYEPELSETDNPHYYDANKLLFDAHVCRVQRKFNDV